MTMTFDRRFTPARPDLAAAHLEGQVEATMFVQGREMHVVAPIADVRSAPAPDASLDTQALCGERVTVYEEHEGWAWCQLQRDSLCRLPAGAYAAGLSQRADPSGHGAAHVRLSRART